MKKNEIGQKQREIEKKIEQFKDLKEELNVLKALHQASSLDEYKLMYKNMNKVFKDKNQLEYKVLDNIRHSFLIDNQERCAEDIEQLKNLKELNKSILLKEIQKDITEISETTELTPKLQEWVNSVENEKEIDMQEIKTSFANYKFYVSNSPEVEKIDKNSMWIKAMSMLSSKSRKIGEDLNIQNMKAERYKMMEDIIGTIEKKIVTLEPPRATIILNSIPDKIRRNAQRLNVRENQNTPTVNHTRGEEKNKEAGVNLDNT